MNDQKFLSRKDVLTRSLIDLARSQVETLNIDSTDEDFTAIGAKLGAIQALLDSVKTGSRIMSVFLANLELYHEKWEAHVALLNKHLSGDGRDLH